MENRVGEQIVDSPVPHFMVEDVEIVLSTPQESVQKRVGEQIADSPLCLGTWRQSWKLGVLHHRIAFRIVPACVRSRRKSLKLCRSRRVRSASSFTVQMLHQHVHRANPSDSVVFNIKGLDKHNMPRFGDVMVPPPQITKVSLFDRKSQVAADEPLYRFQPKRPGRSSRTKLKR